MIGPYAVSVDSFRRQLDAASQGRLSLHFGGRILAVPARRGWSAQRPVLLTFDDGYEDLMTDVLPILEERRIPAVVFPVSRRIGGTNQWDEVLGAPPAAPSRH